MVRLWAAIRGSSELLERLYWIATPWLSKVGEMAPLKTKSVELAIAPSCVSAGTPAATWTSYQLTWERTAGPTLGLTVCWVHMPRSGSPTA